MELLYCLEERLSVMSEGGGGVGGRVCGSADLAKKIGRLRIADQFNNNFSGSAYPISLMDSDFGKNTTTTVVFTLLFTSSYRVRITDSKHNFSRQLNHPLLF